MNASQTQRDECAADLRELCPRGTEILGVRMASNRDGERHWLRLFMASGGTVVEISHRAATVLDTDYRPGKGVLFGGGGMNPVSGTVMNLAYRLYGEGYALKYAE